MTVPACFRVALVTDEPLIRLGLTAAMNQTDGLTLVWQGSHQDVLEGETSRPVCDIWVVDLGKAVRPGIATLAALNRQPYQGAAPAPRLVAVGDHLGDEVIHAALAAGARGYFTRTQAVEDVLEGIRLVGGGENALPAPVAARLSERYGRPELTAREREVLELLARGLGNGEIATVLGIAHGTVKLHVRSILAKLEATDRTEALAVALRRGFVHVC